MELKNKLNNKRGFTLVELLLVIVIIVILGVLLIPNVLETLNESRIENGKSIEKLLIKNLELYNTDHDKDLWNNNNDDYDCNNSITYEELLEFNPDIDLGECLLNNENSFTIEKVGANKYKYYVGLTCGKKLTKDPDNKYLIDKDKEQDSYYSTENPQCNGSITVTANPNKGLISEPLPEGWVKNGDKIQKQMTPGEEFGTLPRIESIENSGYMCSGWNTDKDGAGESITGDTKAQFAIRTIYAECTTTGGDVGRLSFENQTIERNYSTRPLIISLPNDITNGIGPYKYSKKSESYKKNDESTSSEDTNNISISGYTIIVGAGAPVGIYTCEIEVEDLNTKQKATAIYTIRINRVITYLDIPSSPAPKIYTGTEQASGIKCPEGTATSGVEKATKVGTYEQICHIIDPELARWKDTSHSATDKAIQWSITNAECPKPSNINISTAGVVTWTGSQQVDKYQMSTGGNWEVVNSGENQLNKIISNIDNAQNTINKTISIKSLCNDENYDNESGIATKVVTLNKTTFNSNDANKGTVNPTSYYSIQGAEYETSADKLLIKGLDGSGNKATIKTITAEPKTTHHTFDSWSKSNGTINSPETITANFGIKQYTVNVNVLQGKIHDDEVSIKTVDYNTSPTFKLKASETGATGIVSCGSGQNGTIENTTVSGEEVSILTVNNISADTTCVVTFTTTQTVLHEDGTLIINEKASDRASSIAIHGPIMQKTVGDITYDLVYQKTGGVEGYNYIFENSEDQLWKNERSLIKKVKLGQPVECSNSASYWFYGLNNLEEADLTDLDTSRVETMTAMFLNAGSDLNNSKEFKLIGLNNWDTSKVKDMSLMFYQAGFGAGSFNIGNISNWNTSSVTNMSQMFKSAGYKARTFGLDLSSGTGWNTSNVTNMSEMFLQTGFDSDYFELNLTPDTDSWNTSNVINMSSMFLQTGKNARTWSIGNISSWNTSNVTSMSEMFSQAGTETNTWTLGNPGIGEWQVSKVTNMASMFYQSGYKATTWNIGKLDNWFKTETNPVINNTNSMFNGAGHNATSWDIGDLSNWNTSKITNMSSMFLQAGYGTTGEFNIGDIGKWDVSKVTSMQSMFKEAGLNAKTKWYIGDLSTWTVPSLKFASEMFWRAGLNVENEFSIIGNKTTAYLNWNLSQVQNLDNMFNQAGKSARTWKIGDLKNWNVSRVTSMQSMFEQTGYSSSTWSVGDISNWNVSKLQNAHNMFDQAAHTTSNFNLNLSNWFKPETNPAIVTMSSMFFEAGHNASSWSIGDISNWDVSKVTTMANMFGAIAKHTTTINLNLSNWDTSQVYYMNAMFKDAGDGYNTKFNIGSLNIHAGYIPEICSTTNVNGTLNIYNNPIDYTNAFYEASKLTGTSITVNYSTSTTNIDSIINTKTIGSNVIKASSPTLTN